MRGHGRIGRWEGLRDERGGPFGRWWRRSMRTAVDNRRATHRPTHKESHEGILHVAELGAAPAAREGQRVKALLCNQGRLHGSRLDGASIFPVWYQRRVEPAVRALRYRTTEHSHALKRRSQKPHCKCQAAENTTRAATEVCRGRERARILLLLSPFPQSRPPQATHRTGVGGECLAGSTLSAHAL